MAVGLATGLRTTRVDVIKTGIDAGGAAGKLRLYDGIRPATGGAATNLIVELTCTYPCAPGAAAAGTAPGPAVNTNTINPSCQFRLAYFGRR